jgi:hypothetical protein
VSVPVLDMPRKPKTYKLDERLIEALEVLAERSGHSSTGSFVESVLWKYCQGQGVIGLAAEPSLETRGGKRPGAGRPKVAPASDHPLAQDSAESEESQSDDGNQGDGDRA